MESVTFTEFAYLPRKIFLHREYLITMLSMMTEKIDDPSIPIYYLKFPPGFYNREERYILHKMSKKGQLKFSSNGPADNRQITVEWTPALFIN
jgi:hypothetical protein